MKFNFVGWLWWPLPVGPCWTASPITKDGANRPKFQRKENPRSLRWGARVVFGGAERQLGGVHIVHTLAVGLGRVMSRDMGDSSVSGHR